MKIYELNIHGTKVEVKKAVYEGYRRSYWTEKKREQRNARCVNANGIRCRKNCTDCPYYLAGERMRGIPMQYDTITEFCADTSEKSVAEQAFDKIRNEMLHAAIDDLDESSQLICHYIMMGESERSTAKALGVSLSTLQYRKKKLLAELREIMSPYYWDSE